MIILMGSVGSGKTEQGRRLEIKIGCPRISSSQLLREEGKWNQHILEGRLVDDSAVIKILEPELIRAEKQFGEYILDGAPRSVGQAEWLVGLIDRKRVNLTAIIVLRVSDEIVIERLAKRGREDDSIEVIKKRLKDYQEITTPVIEYLKSRGIYISEVNGELPPDEVEQAVDELLGI